MCGRWVVHLIPTKPLASPPTHTHTQRLDHHLGALLEGPETAPFHCIPAKRALWSHGISSREKTLFAAVSRDLPSAAQRRYRASPSWAAGRHPPPVPCRRRPPAPPGGASCGVRSRCSATQEKGWWGSQNRTVLDRAHRSCSLHRSTSGRRKTPVLLPHSRQTTRPDTTAG